MCKPLQLFVRGPAVGSDGKPGSCHRVLAASAFQILVSPALTGRVGGALKRWPSANTWNRVFLPAFA